MFTNYKGLLPFCLLFFLSSGCGGVSGSPFGLNLTNRDAQSAKDDSVDSRMVNKSVEGDLFFKIIPANCLDTASVISVSSKNGTNQQLLASPPYQRSAGVEIVQNNGIPHAYTINVPQFFRALSMHPPDLANATNNEYKVAKTLVINSFCRNVSASWSTSKDYKATLAIKAYTLKE